MTPNYVQVTYDGDINLEIYIHQNTPFGELNQKSSLALSPDNVEKLAQCLNKIIKGESFSMLMDYNL